MVRFQFRLAKKRYLRSKRAYEYGRISLHIPRKYHELIKPFLKQDFDISIAADKCSIVITLKHKQFDIEKLIGQITEEKAQAIMGNSLDTM